MSINLYSSTVSQLQREIERLQRNLADIAKDEASKTKQIADIQKSITKNTSQSTFNSKMRSIQRLQDDIVRLQRKRADTNKKIADKTSKLYDAQGKLSTTQAMEQQKALEAIKQTEQRRNNELVNEIAKLRSEVAQQSPTVFGNKDDKVYDAFISHATEDKKDLVRSLAEALQSRGITVWYDEFELKVGDSLRRSIDKGLAKSRFGIVVLSTAFFAKNWTQYELDGLVAKEMDGGKVILPIWHKIAKDEVMNSSPSLADKLALSTSQYTIEELADRIVEVVKAG
jgi:predicted  nucleic acid-binding Zn-ribbon protein